MNDHFKSSGKDVHGNRVTGKAPAVTRRYVLPEEERLVKRMKEDGTPKSAAELANERALYLQEHNNDPQVKAQLEEELDCGVSRRLRGTGDEHEGRLTDAALRKRKRQEEAREAEEARVEAEAAKAAKQAEKQTEEPRVVNVSRTGSKKKAKDS